MTWPHWQAAKGLSALLETTINALSQVASVCLLLFLIFFVYAAGGVALFGRLSVTPDNPSNGISIHANFENFGMAMLTLFRISTGDNGNGILKDCMREPPACDDSATCKFNCCSEPILAVFFFLSFTLIAQFVLLNVVVAVLMSELEESPNPNPNPNPNLDRDLNGPPQPERSWSSPDPNPNCRRARRSKKNWRPTNVQRPSALPPKRQPRPKLQSSLRSGSRR